MEEDLSTLRDILQDALDELSSPRSSHELKFRALHTLERHLALACVPKNLSIGIHNFNALQYTFECNIPLRLLAWMSLSTASLEVITNKGTMDQERESQASALSSQLSIALSLLQGVSLNHSASKTYLGRKYALEVLLDLLLASRHLSSIPQTTQSSSSSPILPLTSVVLDTLLCILVDSPGALRAFEASSGVQAIVKILKRAGTPREVRMKCLEFLYFYLLDENPTEANGNTSQSSAVSTPPPTAPTTPARPPKPYISNRPLRPSSQYGSSTFSFTSTSSSSSPRSASDSSSHSFSSTSSNGSSSTTPSSISSSPEKISAMPPLKTPPTSPPLSHRQPQQLQPRSLMMLKKEVEFVPLSPKKAQVSRLGVGGVSRHAPGKSISRSRLGSGPDSDGQQYKQSELPETPGREEGSRKERVKPVATINNFKTTEEKKELLGTMLGNVDALVEGVRKAGVWGLG